MRAAAVHSTIRVPCISRTAVCLLALVGFALRGVGAGYAQLDLSSLGAPSFESFSTRDGLPSEVITAVGVDARGFPWVGSPEGLHRFLGHRWQHQVGPEHGTMYRRMLLDRAGTLWAASNDRGLSVLDERGWQFRTEQDGLPPDLYRASDMVGADGRVQTWLLTNESGIYQRHGARWHPDSGNRFLPHPSFLTSSTTTTHLFGEPRQWIGTGEAGLWYRREGEARWQPFRLPGQLVNHVEDVKRSVGRDGEALWISVFGQGVYRINARGVRRWSVESGDLHSNIVYSIAIDADTTREATAWVASRSGLVRVHGEVADVFDRRHGLPSDQIRDVYMWRGPGGENVLWIATENGVARAVFGGTRWRTASLLGSGAIGVFGAVVENGPRGERLWVASARDGIGLYESDRWRQFSTATGDLPANDVRMIRPATDLDGDSALWAGMDPGYLVRIRPGPRFEPIAAPWRIEAGEAPTDVVARRHNGVRELWFGTRKSGIFRWRSDGWTAFRAAKATGEWRIFDLVEQIDTAGRSWLWAGTNQGLARYDGHRWTLLHDVPGLPTKTLLGVSFSVAGPRRQVLWVGSDLDGLIRLDVSDPLAPVVLPNATLPAGTDVTVYGAAHDSRGRVYLCTNTGVQQLTPSPSGWAGKVFGRGEGMVHEECNMNAQWIDRHDRFWTGTLGGLTVFDPDAAQASRPGPLHLVGMQVDNQPVSPEALRLPPDARELRIEFTLQPGQRETETRYRTELVGFDPAPGPWTAEPTRTFTSLAPGAYRLRIQARNYAGVLSQPLELPFRVLPAWWERPLVRVGFAAALALLLVALARWRTRHLRAQKQHLETVVEMRTEQLEHANQRLVELSYTDALTGVANRRMFQKRLDDLIDAEPVSPLCSLILADVDRFKEFNDQFGHPAGDEALRVIAECLRECTPPTALVARYGGEEFACLLPGVPPERARQVAEAMRRCVGQRPISLPKRQQEAWATISAGVAACHLRSELEAHQLLREADAALYRAKSAGRNCVRVQEQPHPLFIERTKVT